ncbi:hypothetical protein Salat_0653200 [Sesamum alatum]|uniref:Uncharacterized protein n=1 Tax=Sesamum alatum TaxID=300844 RepID=A0AAE1YRW4_9LAMI|nr:hypothetical protein Salat_0653200 [Sesamum alatum]
MANDEPPLDDIESGNGSAVVGCPSSEEENALNRLLSEFNLSEFLALANRVIDEAPAVNGCTSFLVPHSYSFSADYGSYSPTRRIPCMPTTEQMNAYLLHTPSVAASFPVPILSLPPSSMASSIFPVSVAAATLAPPSIVTVLEGSQQDPDNQPPSLRVDNQPQYSLPVETSSFKSDSPSIGVDNQPQSSIHGEINSRNIPYFREDKQPQYSLHGETPSFQSDPPSIRVDT